MLGSYCVLSRSMSFLKGLRLMSQMLPCRILAPSPETISGTFCAWLPIEISTVTSRNPGSSVEGLGSEILMLIFESSTQRCRTYASSVALSRADAAPVLFFSWPPAAAFIFTGSIDGVVWASDLGAGNMSKANDTNIQAAAFMVQPSFVQTGATPELKF